MVGYVGNILDAAQNARLLSMQKTARQLDVASARLASGQKVLSALDNPNSFFLARALRNRAGDLSRLLDGIGQNIRTVEVADAGIRAQLKNLDLAESYLEDILERFRAGTLPSGTGLAENETLVTFNNAGEVIQYDPTQDVPASGTISVSGGDTVTFDGNYWRRRAFNYTITPDTVMTFDFRSTLQPEIAAIGFDNDTNFVNNSDRFFLYGTQFTGITYAAPIPTYVYTDIGNWESYEIPVGTYFTGSFSHVTFAHDDDGLPFGNSSYRRIILREGAKQQAVDFTVINKEYARIIGQLDDLARDANYRGINLLQDENMTSVFNESGTSKLVTEGIDATIRGLGLNNQGFRTISQVTAELETVRAARETLRGFASSLASDLNIIKVRQKFTSETINVHEEGADDLTLTDQNEEGAILLALQTRQQLQASMLAFRPRSILEILA